MKKLTKVLFVFSIFTLVLSVATGSLMGAEGQEGGTKVTFGILSVLPPLVAIVCSFILKEVLMSLFLGIFLGALFLCDYNPFLATYKIFNEFFITVLSDTGHLQVLLFIFGIAALIGLLRKSGSLVHLVDMVKSRISSPRSGMVATWAAGLIIFFDDYANSLLIGNTVRPLTDKLRISREKLSYVVDATAAPIASIALSNWVGTQIGFMVDAYKDIDPSVSGMSLYLQSLPYSFYSIFTIFFVFFICLQNRDFGPMRKAEIRARTTGKVLRDGAMPLQDDEVDVFSKGMKKGKWYQAALPLATMIIFIILYIYISGGRKVGFDKPFQDILDGADTLAGLMFGPVVGVAAFFLFAPRLFKIRDAADTMLQGSKTVMIAGFILTFAWTIGIICKELGTAEFLVSIFGDKLPPMLLPTLTFTLSAITSFATGTSWGTMAIMFPIVIPLAHHILGLHDLPPEISHNIMFGTMGSILAGACLGDHSSPISDTTLFSSMACSADHIDHVKTQVPYALTVGAISIFIGYLPTSMGMHWGFSLPLGILLCFIIVRMVGKKNPPPAEST